VSGTTDLLGELLEGRYRIDSPIARGGMSTVYRGLDTRLDRPVAVKVMDPAYAGDPEFLSRFAFEARAVARLSHSGLVAVHDQGSDRGHAFLVMELVEGGTLRELLRERGAMPPEVALSVLEPVLAALSTAHRAGLVHRDVKPENVLVADDGTVKVADFGLVRAVAAAGHTASNVILGTAAYLSPEQVTTGAADARSDVYAAGILLHELLTGAPPYTGDTALSVAYQHVNGTVPAPSSTVAGLPPELDELVATATDRDPRHRYRDAGQMLGEVLAVRRALGLPRVRVPTPQRSAEHASHARPGAPASPVQHTRALTGLVPRPPGADTLQPEDTDRVPTVNAYQAQRRRSRRAGLVWFVVVVLLAAAVGVGAWWLGSGRFTNVPEVTGLDKAQAEQVLTAAHLDAVLRSGYDDSGAVDMVLAAQPAAGAKVERGSHVLVTVSLGRPTVPQVAVGTAQAAVEQQLTASTLRPTVGPGAYDDVVPEGALLALQPPAGTTVTVGSGVTLTLSQGPAPVTVPDVTGRAATDATAALTSAGLTAGTTSTAFSPTVAGGAVVSTAPAAGASSRRGTAVDLVVSSALTVPDVTGQSAERARATLSAAGFTPVEGGTTSGGSADAGAVAATSPAAGTLVDPAAAQVRVVVSDLVTVPGLRGRSVGAARQTLEALGLQVRVSQLVPTDSSLVLSQDPSGGTRVRPGSTVTLTAFP
jgi:beta-lactam-binding protein with PASTA domain/serine/threonine protein kinase